MTIVSRSLFAAVSLFGVVCSSQASTLGFNDPLGAPVSGVTGYAAWDTFVSSTGYPTITIAPSGPTSSDTNVFSTNLSASMGGSVTGSGERIYNGTGQTSAAFNLLIAGTVSVAIDSITLQIKLTPPDVGTGLTRTTFFDVNLNGIAGTAVLTNPGTGEFVGNPPNALELGVVTYTWSGLNLQAGNAVNIGITSPALGHVSVDALRVDASAVPEPSTYAMLIAAAGVLIWLKRRRSSAV